ncbi:MAG: undecaprenyl-diphosphate phosphatase [Deferribacteraceae bacterium]|jgi:undecaprenyl-diphosphatase|nr:undecaprenyl-diphosphate phosphatase [Deferribacteraceae bacterium]
MTFLQALVLGVLQGVTEFLPVSSSGHLALVQSLFQDFEQPGLLYDTMLHAATMLAIFFFFRKRMLRLFKAVLGIFLAKYNVCYYEEKNLLAGIVIATIPTGIIGYLLKDYAQAVFEKPAVVGYCLIITSLMLFLADSQIKRGKISPIKSLLVGISQGLAVFPGISRSGTTIFVGLKAGISREDTAEFSFLISIPAILGATLLQLRHIDEVTSSSGWFNYIAGMTAAFIFGVLSIRLILGIVKSAKMSIFAIYCLIIGISAIVWL